MSFKKVLAALFVALGPTFPGGRVVLALVRRLIEKYLNRLPAETFAMEGAVGNTGASAAPQEFKDWVKAQLKALAAMVPWEFVQAILNQAIDGLTDEILDRVWDMLFGKKLPPLMGASDNPLEASADADLRADL